ncbi:hypothetical protein [Acidovorax sp. SUPP2539]|uniref:hypothetical protein n=1 Tax=Acidovorax sp. SUPP2539 TaxID=2920878 RepID=UPI0023DE61C8|nr:hypothetical protein [Acidovorax sp. SUPP2539]GKS91197.1 hypothetical protein AVTE2539_17550 [Acidovorax sp. SUPP2539]
MAESWIRMRGSLPTNPRVIAMARALLADPDFLDWYGHTDVTAESSRAVTMRHVTVVTRVTVGALVPLWAMVNECAAEDGILHKTTLFEVDAMAGVPGFGHAMRAVGWIFETPDGVRFPNFHEHNTVKESRSTAAKTPAVRAKEYRDRQKSESATPSRNSSRDGVTEKRDASRDAVTTDKRREEKNIEPPTGVQGGEPPPSPSGVKFEIPEWMPAQPWEDFVSMRRAKGKRAPFTVAAAKGIVRELEKFREQGHDPAAVLQASVMNGWSGVFAPGGRNGAPAGSDWTSGAQ